MSKDFKPIIELLNKIIDGSPCIYVEESDKSESLMIDMADLFGVDPQKNVLCNVTHTEGVIVGDLPNKTYLEELVNIPYDFIVLPETIERRELLVKLADYLEGSRSQLWVKCWCKYNDQICEFTIENYDNDNKYVEGGYEVFLSDFPDGFGVYFDEYPISFSISSLKLGVTNHSSPISPIVDQIKNGKHFINTLIDLNDDILFSL